MRSRNLGSERQGWPLCAPHRVLLCWKSRKINLKLWRQASNPTTSKPRARASVSAALGAPSATPEGHLGDLSHSQMEKGRTPPPHSRVYLSDSKSEAAFRTPQRGRSSSRLDELASARRRTPRTTIKLSESPRNGCATAALVVSTNGCEDAWIPLQDLVGVRFEIRHEKLRDAVDGKVIIVPKTGAVTGRQWLSWLFFMFLLFSTGYAVFLTLGPFSAFVTIVVWAASITKTFVDTEGHHKARHRKRQLRLGAKQNVRRVPRSGPRLRNRIDVLRRNTRSAAVAMSARRVRSHSAAKRPRTRIGARRKLAYYASPVPFPLLDQALAPLKASASRKTRSARLFAAANLIDSFNDSSLLGAEGHDLKAQDLKVQDLKAQDLKVQESKMLGYGKQDNIGLGLGLGSAHVGRVNPLSRTPRRTPKKYKTRDRKHADLHPSLSIHDNQGVQLSPLINWMGQLSIVYVALWHLVFSRLPRWLSIAILVAGTALTVATLASNPKHMETLSVLWRERARDGPFGAILLFRPPVPRFPIKLEFKQEDIMALIKLRSNMLAHPLGRETVRHVSIGGYWTEGIASALLPSFLYESRRGRQVFHVFKNFMIPVFFILQGLSVLVPWAWMHARTIGALFGRDAGVLVLRKVGGVIGRAGVNILGTFQITVPDIYQVVRKLILPFHTVLGLIRSAAYQVIKLIWTYIVPSDTFLTYLRARITELQHLASPALRLSSRLLSALTRMVGYLAAPLTALTRIGRALATAATALASSGLRVALTAAAPLLSAGASLARALALPVRIGFGAVWAIVQTGLGSVAAFTRAIANVVGAGLQLLRALALRVPGLAKFAKQIGDQLLELNKRDPLFWTRLRMSSAVLMSSLFLMLVSILYSPPVAAALIACGGTPLFLYPALRARIALALSKPIFVRPRSDSDPGSPRFPTGILSALSDEGDAAADSDGEPFHAERADGRDALGEQRDVKVDGSEDGPSLDSSSNDQEQLQPGSHPNSLRMSPQDTPDEKAPPSFSLGATGLAVGGFLENDTLLPQMFESTGLGRPQFSRSSPDLTRLATVSRAGISMRA